MSRAEIDVSGTRLDWTMTQGDKFVWEVTVLDPDEGTVLDITGYTFEMDVALAPGQTALASATVTLTDPTNGVVEFEFADTATATFVGRNHYDMQYSDDLGDGPWTIYWGWFTARADVTA